MAGRIPQGFIDDLLDRVDIVEIIDSRVPLKKSGKNYSACCPFHDEKTPSFTVSPDKQFYYCFGCGASGSALGFLLEYERLPFPEAVEYLAGTQGLEVPREAGGHEASPQRQDIYALLDRVAKYYQEQLRSHPASEVAKSYLQNRGLSGQTAHSFGIGFAPAGWDNLLGFMGQDDHSKGLLLEAGMVILNEEKQRLYDRFRERVMFPIRDVRGRVIAFGGRVLGDEKPKYLNSPETEVFHKGRELYGLYEANQANRRLERLLVVEGYMDVVALAQWDINFAAATLGTAAGTSHLEKAFRYTSEVVFCFDGDEAGRKAAERALESSLPALQEGRQVRFMFLPEGEDPDSLVQKEQKEGFLSRVEQALPLSEYLFDLGGEGLNLSIPEGRAALIQRLRPMFQKIPESPYKEQLKNLLATQSQSVLASLNDALEYDPRAEKRADKRGKSAPPPSQEPPPWGEDGYPGPAEGLADSYSGDDYGVDYAPSSAEVEAYGAEAGQDIGQKAENKGPKFKRLNLFDEAASLLLQFPDFIEDCEKLDLALLEKAAMPEAQRLSSLISLVQETPGASLNKILGLWQSQHGAAHSEELYQLAAREWLLDISALQKQFQDILAKITQKLGDQPLELLIEKARQGLISGEEKEQLNQLLLGKAVGAPQNDTN